MARNDEENVFSSPWNDSDMVLVVEDQELHVHKWILTLQSPVFKAMLDGHFKEASQDKITLKEKSFRPMLQFLKVLYPSSMFVEDNASLNDESRLSIMPLAEEYQCVNLIKQFINEIQVTRENVMKILPYVVKYHQTALPKLCDIIKRSTPTSQLKEVLPKLESKEASSTINILLTKCDFLESGIVQMQDAMISLMRDFHAGQKRKADDANNSLKAAKYTRKAFFTDEIDYLLSSDIEIVTDSRCHHTIDIRQINKAKSCVHCKEMYKEKFIAPIPSRQNNAQNFFDMLEKGDEVATVIKNSLPQRATGSKRKIKYDFWYEGHTSPQGKK